VRSQTGTQLVFQSVETSCVPVSLPSDIARLSAPLPLLSTRTAATTHLHVIDIPRGLIFLGESQGMKAASRQLNMGF